jgi:hypothetical protein
MKCDRNSIGLGPRGLEPREEPMKNTLFVVYLSPQFYPRPYALGPRPFTPLAAKIIKSFCRGMRAKRKAQSAKRIIQLTLCAKRHAPCAFPLAGGTYE